MLGAGLLSTLLPPGKIPSFPVPHVRLFNHCDGKVACLLGTLDIQRNALSRLFWKVRVSLFQRVWWKSQADVRWLSVRTIDDFGDATYLRSLPICAFCRSFQARAWLQCTRL